jgi:septum formation protein
MLRVMSLDTQIYLASQSPRRADLLAQIGVSFRPLLLRDDPRGLAEVDETSTQGEEPLAYVQRICAAKANAAWESACYRQLTPLPVLAADTTVVVDGKIIGKPQDRADAARILRILSGRQHQVLSAVALRLHDRSEMRVSNTAVTFTALSDERIRHYLASGEADDKAGAYGIQGLAGAFVQRIEGSYSGVVGLPLYETTELLQLLGYEIP